MPTQPPNILFVSYEDTSPRFGAYGDKLAQTPVFDRIAAEGVRFNQCFCTSPTCGPSRSCVFTGMYQTVIHCQHMRTTHTNKYAPELPTPYVAVPPFYVKCFTEYLRAVGYFCTRQGKADFAFVRDVQGSPLTAFDRVVEPMPTNITEHSSGETPDPTWRQRPPGAPFFAFYNLDATHESGQWARADRLEPRTDPRTVEVPPYLPDTLEVRKAIARQYDNLAKDDVELGHLIRFLEEDGLLDNTIIMIWADHGEGLPRSKRRCTTGGLRVPLVIRYPRLIKAGTVEHGPVSNVDLAPTLFSLANIPAPAHFQGIPVAGPHSRKRDMAFSGRDRIGENYEYVRAVRDERYTYIQNRDTLGETAPWEEYIMMHPAMQTIWSLRAQGKLPELTERVFFGPRAAEELYDRPNDPWEINNLAGSPDHQERLAAFRAAQDQWDARYDLWRDLSEEALVRMFWPDGTMPATASPRAFPKGPSFNGRHPVRDGDRLPSPVQIQLHCPTHGASIAWSLERLGDSTPPGAPWEPDTGPINYDTPWKKTPDRQKPPEWRLYTRPTDVAPGDWLLRTRAIRYGYAESAERLLTFRVV